MILLLTYSLCEVIISILLVPNSLRICFELFVGVGGACAVIRLLLAWMQPCLLFLLLLLYWYCRLLLCDGVAAIGRILIVSLLLTYILWRVLTGLSLLLLSLLTSCCWGVRVILGLVRLALMSGLEPLLLLRQPWINFFKSLNAVLEVLMSEKLLLVHI